MPINVNLNTIWVLSILLLVIIILSGIKICDSPIKSNASMTSNPLFVDKQYKYISEPFTGTEETETPTPTPTLDFSTVISNMAKDKYETTLAQTIELSKQNSKIGILTRQIDALENKIKVLQQY